MPKKCNKCGKQNNDRAKFCNGCGTPFPASPDALSADKQIPPLPQIPTVTPPSNIGSVHTIPASPTPIPAKQPNSEFTQASETLLKIIALGHLNELKELTKITPIKYNVIDKFVNNRLLLAISLGHVDIATYLIESGSNPNEKNESGETPIFMAIDNGNLKMLELLIQKGANINIEDKTGLTPLDLAVRQNSPDMVGLLVQNGVNVKKVDKLGWTPLHRAAFLGHLEVAKILKNCEADINARDKANRTPLFYADKEGHEEVCNYLKKFGAEK